MVKIRNYLSSFDWNSAVEDPNIDESWATFRNAILYCIYLFVPIRYCTVGGSRKVWSKGTIQMHRKQLRLHRRYKRNPTETNKLDFSKSYKEARTAKRNDILMSENMYSSDPSDRRFWSFVRSRIVPKAQFSHIEENGTIITDSKQKATAFNDFFSSVFKLDDGIPLDNIWLPN